MKTKKSGMSPLAILAVLIGAIATLAWTGMLAWGLFEIVGRL
jgi:hypothetical protein